MSQVPLQPPLWKTSPKYRMMSTRRQSVWFWGGGGVWMGK